jgi:hypothetical protein
MTIDEARTLVEETAQLVSSRLGDARNPRCRELLAGAHELLVAANTGTIDRVRLILIAAMVVCEAAGNLEKPITTTHES